MAVSKLPKGLDENSLEYQVIMELVEFEVASNALYYASGTSNEEECATKYFAARRQLIEKLNIILLVAVDEANEVADHPYKPLVELLADRAVMRTGDKRKAVKRFTSYGWDWFVRVLQNEVKKAVRAALRRPQLQLLNEARYNTSELLECSDCIEKRAHRVAGQAFTSFTCKGCGRGASHHNTATPNLCDYCAFKSFMCRRCMQSLNKELQDDTTTQPV